MFEGQRASGGPGLDLLDLLEVRGPPPTMATKPRENLAFRATGPSSGDPGLAISTLTKLKDQKNA